MKNQNNASKLLLAIMESRHDSENAEKILYKMRPNELVSSSISYSSAAVGWYCISALLVPKRTAVQLINIV